MELNMDLTVLDAKIEVEYKMYKARRGARDSFMGKSGQGVQLEPDEPAEVAIQSITMFGKEIEVSDKSLMEIEEAIMESLSEEDGYEGD